MRILVLAEDVPWPETNGGRIRTANVVRALASLGEVDVFAHVSTDEPAAVPAGEPARRIGSTPRTRATINRWRDLRWVMNGKVPREYSARDYTQARRDLRQWMQGPYDLAWVGNAETFVAFEPELSMSKIVDLYDLGDTKLRWRLAAARDPSESTAASARARVRRRARTAVMRVNLRRWRQLHAHVVARARAVVVASELDHERLGCADAWVIPNGYSRPVTRCGHLESRDPATVIIQGSMTYDPNIDGAEFFVGRVWPELRRLRPTAELRIVGAGNRRVGTLASTPGVTVTGYVPEIEAELRLADIAAVPLRFGGGTRLKILESFAHGIPVVSTRVGCEGLKVKDGEHLVVADEPEAFGAACDRLIGDQALRHRVVAAALALFEDEYEWGRIRPSIIACAERVIEPRG